MTSPPKRGPTIKDVANAAGVSTATVSKYMSGNQRFSPEVEQRVAKAAQDLGWSSNPMARAMMTGRTGNVGIVVADIRSPTFNRLLDGATRGAVAAGFNFFVTDVMQSGDIDLEMIKALARRVDGLIVSSRLPTLIATTLFGCNIPLVFYGGPTRYSDYHSVSCDNFKAGRVLGEHLRERGYRAISYLGFPLSPANAERWRGLRSAYDGTQAAFRSYALAALVPEEGERLAPIVLESENMPDVVIAFNDLVALGFLAKSRELGFDVPDRLAVAAFDNTVYGRLQNPSLTSVDMASEEIGEVAMKCLSEIINGRKYSSDTILDAKLIIRKSTMKGA